MNPGSVICQSIKNHNQRRDIMKDFYEQAIQTLQLAGMSQSTQECYARSVRQLIEYCGKNTGPGLGRRASGLFSLQNQQVELGSSYGPNMLLRDQILFRQRFETPMAYIQNSPRPKREKAALRSFQIRDRRHLKPCPDNPQQGFSYDSLLLRTETAGVPLSSGIRYRRRKNADPCPSRQRRQGSLRASARGNPFSLARLLGNAQKSDPVLSCDRSRPKSCLHFENSHGDRQRSGDAQESHRGDSRLQERRVRIHGLRMRRMRRTTLYQSKLRKSPLPDMPERKGVATVGASVGKSTAGPPFHVNVYSAGMRSRFHSPQSKTGLQGFVQSFGGIHEKTGSGRKAYRWRSSGIHRNTSYMGPPTPVSSAYSLYRSGRGIRQKGRQLALFAPRLLSARQSPFENIPRQIPGRDEDRRSFASDRSKGVGNRLERQRPGRRLRNKYGQIPVALCLQSRNFGP